MTSSYFIDALTAGLCATRWPQGHRLVERRPLYGLLRRAHGRVVFVRHGGAGVSQPIGGTAVHA